MTREAQFPISPERSAWYALRVRSRSEQAVSELLALKDMESFGTVWDDRKLYSDRVRRVNAAAFPGYLFCRFALIQKISVLATPGVQNILGCGPIPEPVEDSVILSLRRAFASPGRVAPSAYISAGDLVRVVRGPLAGVEGALIRQLGAERLVISVHLLQRAVSVEVEADAVVPVQRRRTMNLSMT